MTDTIKLAREALVRAREFIRNGVELGFIRMPDPDTPDPAHETPRLIDAALAALSTAPGESEEALTYVNPKVFHDAEETECAHKVLDDMKVPRGDDAGTFSLVGRIKAALAQETSND